MPGHTPRPRLHRPALPPDNLPDRATDKPALPDRGPGDLFPGSDEWTQTVCTVLFGSDDAPGLARRRDRPPIIRWFYAVQRLPRSTAWVIAAFLAEGWSFGGWEYLRVYDALVVLPGADRSEIRRALGRSGIAWPDHRLVTFAELHTEPHPPRIALWCLTQACKRAPSCTPPERNAA
jgi:hypothetical protein